MRIAPWIMRITCCWLLVLGCFGLVACGSTPGSVGEAEPTAAGIATPLAATLVPTTLPAPTATLVPPTIPALAAPTPAQTTFRTIPLTIGEHTLQVELAASPEERSQGLMFREQLAEDAGMLFVFPEDGFQSFWMRNTPIPLSIAFIDSAGRIVNIADMEPFDEQTFHQSAGMVRYALEVNQGWFAERGIGPGDQVEFRLPADLVVR